MQPVKASGWINTDISEAERQSLLMAGIVPVNDVFYDLWDNDNEVNLLLGGYGSGKSVFIQTLLLHLCRSQKYFKGYFGRKIFEDVRGSVHSKFVTLIEDLHLQGEFKYSKEPNGSMIIVQLSDTVSKMIN
jgi:phage terminase large subunit